MPKKSTVIQSRVEFTANRMKIYVTLLALLLSCNNWRQLQAANVLCIVATAEHNNPAWSQPFFEALAARGHRLNIVSTAPDPDIKGINHIGIKNDYDVIQKQYAGKTGNFLQSWDIKQMLIWYEALLGNCRAVLDTVPLAELHAEYDLIIYDATYSMDCLMTRLAKQSETPVLALSGGKLTGDLLSLMHAEDTINPARVPYFTSQLPIEMNYWQRIQNHAIYLGETFIRWGVINPVLHGMLRAGYKNPEVQVMLLNTHPSLDYVQNLPPNVIEVGGLHIRAESSPLPLSLQAFVERFPEGIVYISLPHLDIMFDSGSQAIENMIKEFSQIGFILNGKNMKLSRKFNNLRTIDIEGTMQQDILAQSNVKAFITHGDSFGLQEAIYNAVPVIVVPLLMDQVNNAKRIEERNFGLRLTSDLLTNDSFVTALKHIIRKEIFTVKLRQAQASFRTRQAKPLAQAIWYAEQLMADPELFKYLLHSESEEQNYFVSHSFDVIILPILFIAFFMGNVAYMIVAATKTKKPNKKAKLIKESTPDKQKEREKSRAEKEKAWQKFKQSEQRKMAAIAAAKKNT